MPSAVIFTDLLLKELQYQDGEHIPGYLLENAEWERRDRVRRGLQTLRQILDERRPGMPLEQLIPVYLAVLYSATEARFQNLYEVRAANSLLREHEEEATRIEAAIAASLSVRLTGSTIPLAARLICFHKMADRVVSDRLALAVYEKITRSIVEAGGVPIQVGLVAAADYNVSGTMDDDAPWPQRMASIYAAWREGQPYPADARHYDYQRSEVAAPARDAFDVLWDYPLKANGNGNGNGSTAPAQPAHLSPAAFAGFAARALEVMEREGHELWGQTTTPGSDGSLFVTINYAQSRLVMDADYRELMAQGAGSPIYSHGSFAIETIDGLDARLGLGDKARVLEFRVSPELALRAVRGETAAVSRELRLPRTDPEPVADTATLEDYVHWVDGEDYLPVPLLDRYFRVMKAMASPDLFEQIVLSLEGTLEPERPDTFSVVVPRRDALRDAVNRWSRGPRTERRRRHDLSSPAEATVVRFIAATAVNLGACFGFDRIRIAGSIGSISWTNEVIDVISSKSAGFELMIRYIETYMRSHEVALASSDSLLIASADYEKALDVQRQWSPELTMAMRLRDKDLAVALDVGASTVKYCCYELDEEKGFRPLFSFRLGVQKPGGARYTSLVDFAERIVDDLRHRLAAHDRLDALCRLRVFGISWPGVVRNGKLAGASGILGNFEPAVASNWIRGTAVDHVRTLDLVAAFRQVLSSTAETGGCVDDVTVAMCNDAQAEAVGRFVEDCDILFPPADACGVPSISWLVLKLGTGTGGRVITETRILGGPAEFGKLVHDAYSTGRHDLGDENKLPKGNVNEYASSKLLPAVYQREISTDAVPQSREIGLIRRYYDEWNEGNDPVERLALEIGLDVLHREKLQSIVERPRIDDDNHIDWEGDWKRTVCWRNGIGVESNEAIEALASTAGMERLALLLNLPLGQDICRASIAQLLAMLDERLATVFDHAALFLADVIMLLRGYYGFDGVVLCGGVLRDSVGAALLPGMTRYLDERYGIDFRPCSGLTEAGGAAGPAARDKGATLYYHMFGETAGGTGAGHDVTQPRALDRGESGALHHALAIRHVLETRGETANARGV